MKKITIVPAIIASKQEELDYALSKVKGAKRIQLDIMDGDFVQNNSLDFNFKLPLLKGLYEAHLMVADPEAWIEKNSSKVDVIIPHYSAIKDKVEEVIKLIRSKGKLAGLAINPEIGLDKISKYLDRIDHLLVMTVNPGFYGSKFLPDTLNKVKKARALYPDLDIEVDGGMDLKNTSSVKKAGANIIVSGSFIMKSDDPKARIKELLDA